MYVKLFKNSKGGSTGSIKYLLNEREKEGTAKILKGDRKLTEDIIKSISNKQKTTVGVLSFEERTLTAAQKEELMAEFEKTIFAGMSPDEYNILWVEHIDKDRLELNFVIPKIHLPTQKAFNPYYHAVDFPRIEMFEDIYNIKYNLTSKKDPSKAQTLLGAKKEFNLFKDYQQLDEQLHELVKSGDIQSREHLVELLINNSIEVTRQGKDYLSVKMPDSKKAKKLKGSIYDEQFTSLKKLETISEATDRRIKEFQQRDTSRELEQTIKRLDSYNEQKAQFNREKYQQDNARYTRAKQAEIQPRTPLDISISGSHTSGIHPEDEPDSSLDNTTRVQNKSGGNEIHESRKVKTTQKQFDTRLQVHQNNGVENDTRATTLRRIRKTAESIREQSIRDSRELPNNYSEHADEIRKQLNINRARAHQHIERDNRTLQEQAQKVVRERERQRSIRERFREALEGFGRRFIEFKNDLNIRLFGIGKELADHIEAIEKYKQQNRVEWQHEYNYLENIEAYIKECEEKYSSDANSDTELK